MRVAGSIAELIEFAKDRNGRGGAEGGGKLIEGGDLRAVEEAQEGLRGEQDRSHNAIVPFISSGLNRTIA
jgi:hypothetical protein